MKTLNLSQNQISEIKGLKELRNLEVLDLSRDQWSYNYYSNNLEALDFSEIRRYKESLISEIKGLDSLINLRILNLSYNNISEIKNSENVRPL